MRSSKVLAGGAVDDFLVFQNRNSDSILTKLYLLQLPLLMLFGSFAATSVQAASRCAERAKTLLLPAKVECSYKANHNK